MVLQSRFRKHCDPLVPELARWIQRHGSDPAAWKKDPDGQLLGLRDAAKLEAVGGEVRDELQAWLLSGADHESIACRMGITPAAIQSYIAMFYDFGSPQAIFSVLMRVVHIGDWAYRQPTEAEIWKYLALAGGPHVLGLVLADHFDWLEPQYQDRARTARLLRASVLAYSEGLRSLLEVREVLALADLWLASTHARRVTPDPTVAVHIQFLQQVGALQRGPASPRPTPVVTPVSARPDDVVKPGRAHADLLEISS